jgi:hypothetical protein
MPKPTKAAQSKAKVKAKTNIERKLMLVETVSIFKTSYAIECSDPEHASDTVVCEEAVPFDGQYLDEVITSVREITHKEYDKLVSKSMDEHMGRKMINRVDYETHKVIQPYVASGKKPARA